MIGKTISHYEILEQIGEGGMGVVYKARDTTLDRHVAIKFLPPHLRSDSRAKKRFVREAKAASALNHANIAVVHEIDETPEGQMFIVMAYYEGQTLEDKLEGGGLDVDEAIAIVSQIASGLSNAHEKNILHRDIKPANILLGVDGQAKLADFGLAKLTGQTRVTKSGTTVGTVAYMSPEQASGGDVDHRSDIFSLGVVLYELVTGKLPFRGDHEAAILYAIANEDPSRVVKYRSGVRDGIQQIIDKALAKNPEDRHQSTIELQRELDAVLRGGTVPIAPADKKRRLLIALPLLAATAVAAWLLWPTTTPPTTQALAIVDFQDIANPDNSAFSAGIAGLLQVGLVENAPCRIVSPEYLYDVRRRLFDSPVGPITPDQALEIARKCGATILLSGQWYGRDMGEYITWKLVDTTTGTSLGARRVDGEAMSTLADGVIAGVLPILAKYCGAQSPSAPTPVTNLTTASEEAYANYREGMDLIRMANIDAGIRKLEAAVEADSAFALAWFGLAKAYGGARSHGDKERGKPGCDAGNRAWALRSRLGIKDRMLLEGWLAKDCREEIVGAIETHREIVARWPDDRTALVELAGMLSWIHIQDEALSVVEHAREKYPNDMQLKEMAAWLSGSLGRGSVSVMLARELAVSDPDNPNHWLNMGVAYLNMGKPDSAETAFQRALDIDPEFIWSKVGKASCHFFRGEIDESIEELERLETSDISSAVRYDIRVGDLGLAHMFLEKGQFERTLDIIGGTYDDAYLLGRRLAVYLRFMQLPEPQFDEIRQTYYQRSLALLEGGRTPLEIFRGHSAVFEAALAVDSIEVARRHFEAMEETREGLFPANLFWWSTCATFSLADGRGEEALRYLERARRMGTPDALTEIQLRTKFARAYRMLGRYEEAATTLEELHRIYKGHWLAQYELGKVYENMGRSRDAIAAYEAFLDAWSDADPGLFRVTDARQRLSELRSSQRLE